MHPQSYEIEQVGQAFITIGTPEYTPEQQNYLTNILNEYAQDVNKDELIKIFKDKIQVADAIKILNDFALHYQNEKEVIDEFNEEIENLLISINQYDEGVTF